MDASQWGPAVVNLVFSVAVAWYLLSKALPAMHERFSTDLKMQQETFKEALKEQREDNEKALDREKEALERLMAMVQKEEIDLLRRNSEETHATYKMLEDYIRNSRGNRERIEV